ncbi:hypothetical protein B0H15DRAFT_915615 [Mycena belliarum]|uniref:Asteroid domain-containing protein n=1 Tax=Mycena belliarum TaxID=1033014 RepID=A0AAD6TWL1_9AGAR|nr:hypothetical protein B0H15DRAFT_915615 [Mycena belliae]
MGVHGLSTYLRENRRLSETHCVSGGDPLAASKRTKIVVDGWSFIYDLYRNSGLPWVYGGDYPAFRRIVTTVVNAWLSVGLTIYFVFDGACPSLKFSTLVSRLVQSNISHSLIFFRTSEVSRSSPRFLNEIRIIPPFSYTACLDALRAICQATDAVTIHYADEEGDPYAVELAGKVGAFVVGTDSDFVVLNSEGYRGYIPLDEMVWNIPISGEPPAVEDDGDFQQVRKPKSKKKLINTRMGRGIIPPDSTSGLSLSFTAYSPLTLAAHLNVPVTLLPLLGALVGNDFSNRSASPRKNVQMLFFERQTSLSQRINRVAATIQSILSASQKGKQKQVGTVMDLIDRTVNALLVRSISSMGSGEVEAIIERIVEATLQYALPKNEAEIPNLWPTEICALHEADICPILPMFSRLVTAEASLEDRDNDDELLKRNELRGRYLSAYRRGQLHAKVLDILHTGTSWPRLFLETPDFETVSRAVGRPVRQWCYAILHDTVGLPFPPTEDEDTGEGNTSTVDVEEDEDELIDVVESDSDDERGSDLLAPLKGALQRLHNPDDASSAPTSSSQTRSGQLPIITEYVRRGTRIAEELVTVPSISDLLSSISSADFAPAAGIPVLARSEHDRLSILLRALKSDTIPIRSLPPDKLAVALCLRWVLLTFHLRALETGSKEREKERWTRKEARSFLGAFSWTAQQNSSSEQDKALPEIMALPEILARNVQLTAQVLTALESIDQFSQILLLSDRVPSPASSFSGSEFHSCLTGIKTVDVPDTLWDACTRDIEDTFTDERKKKPKKSKLPTASPTTDSRKSVKGASLYELLVDAEA